MTDHLKNDFEKAARDIQLFHGVDLTNEEKLKLYSLFKQATVGDVQGTQPWSVYVESRAKWDAWSKLKGKSKDASMMEYIAQVKHLLSQYNIKVI